MWISIWQEGVFERRTSIGSEAFYRLNLYWYLTLPLYERFAKKFGQNNYLSMHAETSLPSLPSLPSLKNAVKVSNVPYINCLHYYINCLHYQKSERENLPLLFWVYNSVECFLIISLDSIKFAPQAVKEDQYLKRPKKKYHPNCKNNMRSSAWKRGPFNLTFRML